MADDSVSPRPRVLIARPEPQASAMAAELAALGWEPVVEPMLAVHLEEGVAARLLARPALPAALIVTSANGVAALAADPALPDLFAVPVIAVGPATATAARTAGFIAVIECGGDADAVVKETRRHIAPRDGILVHVAGRDRTGDVADRLSALGWPTEVVEAYRAEAREPGDAPALRDLVADRFDAAIVASARTAEALRRSLQEAGLERRLDRTVLVAISAAAAAPLADCFGRMALAESADAAGLTKAVVALRPPVANNDGDGRGPGR